jgi:hypothetical protein
MMSLFSIWSSLERPPGVTMKFLAIHGGGLVRSLYGSKRTIWSICGIANDPLDIIGTVLT